MSAPRRPACTRPCARLCTGAGFTAAYRIHRPALVRIARATLGDLQAAEDAVQEAFVRAWAACSSFDPGQGPPLYSWLARITRNVAIDHARARAIRPRLAGPTVEDRAEPVDAGDDAEHVVLRAVVAEALDTVSEQHRRALELTVLQDRSYTDAAAELGVPVGTVKSRVHYALAGLRGLAVLRPA